VAHLYYLDAPELSELSEQDCPLTREAEIRVSGEDGRHAVRVARLREGENILVGDGCGCIAKVQVTHTGADYFRGRVTGVTQHPVEQPQVVLVQALAKGDRDERAVEQATEFGVGEVWAWQASRSVSRWSNPEKRDKGLTKWRRIAREASKQALRAHVPQISWCEQLGDLAELDTVLVLHPWAHKQFSDVVSALPVNNYAAGTGDAERVDAETGDAERPGSATSAARAPRVGIVVGPEGGFAEHELQDLARIGAVQVKLGNTVLRTSSAGPAALAAIHTLLQRW
jgi:16S rRNA (uracil1498-N3)-methyltransferase